MDEKSIMEQQMKLLQTVVEQQQSYIQAQNALVAEKDARMAEKDETIAQLRKLVDDLQSLKANLEETLRELRRQLFGTISERTIAEEPDAEESQPAGEPTRRTCLPRAFSYPSIKQATKLSPDSCSKAPPA